MPGLILENSTESNLAGGVDADGVSLALGGRDVDLSQTVNAELGSPIPCKSHRAQGG